MKYFEGFGKIKISSFNGEGFLNGLSTKLTVYRLKCKYFKNEGISKLTRYQIFYYKLPLIDTNKFFRLIRVSCK